MAAYTRIDEIEKYICELVEKLQIEKELSLKHLFFLIKTTNKKKLKNNQLVAKCGRKMKKLEKELMDILWFHNVRVITDGGEILLLRNLTASKAYRAYRSNRVTKTGPNTLEQLLDLQKKINSVYQDLVNINLMI